VAELERELRALQLEWPSEPELAPRVRARLATERRPRFGWRGVAAVAVALVAIAIGAAFAVPSARSAILRWLGLEHVRVVRVETLPPAHKLASADLGTRTTMAGAARRADFGLLRLPQPPDSVYVATTDAGARVTFVYGDVERPRLLVSELRGFGVTKFVQKLYGSGTRVERVEVGGEPGLWLSGAPHAVYYGGPDSLIHADEPVLAGNTLVWERRGGVIVRLEGDLSKHDALVISKRFR
jgi:hypothetical protein